MHPLIDPLPPPTIATERVPMSLFRRHLGLPACAELDERLAVLAEKTRDWYRVHGRPWTDARPVSIQRIDRHVIYLSGGLQLQSPLLAEGLERASAEALVVVAATAGEEVDRQVGALWKDERPDEAIFLNAYAIAVVEHLRWQAGDHLRNAYESKGMIVLPHYSPGYEGWDLSDQENLFRIVCGDPLKTSRPLRILPSGGLWPSKSIIAAFGISPDMGMTDRVDDYWTGQSVASETNGKSPPAYSFPKKTLELWRSKRLQITAEHGGRLSAKFRFDGSTCNNMGVALAFDYEVHLARDGNNGYRIEQCSCRPAEGHDGYRSMCAVLDDPERHLESLESYQPFLGRPLQEVLSWRAAVSPAGCLCTRASQDHKWRIVLQTIHFALEDHD